MTNLRGVNATRFRLGRARRDVVDALELLRQAAAERRVNYNIEAFADLPARIDSLMDAACAWGITELNAAAQAARKQRRWRRP